MRKHALRLLAVSATYFALGSSLNMDGHGKTIVRSIGTTAGNCNAQEAS